ncbi:MAG: FecR domain-containing protein [Proteobacteria bacterium]|nr:FecR domain-containing protein [Pseudomonadota bacterium]
MKNKYVLFLTCFFVLISFDLFAFTSSKGVGKIKILQAPVSIERAGKKIKVGSFGTAVLNDDLIVTGVDGRAQVTLQSGDVILIAPNSRLKINQEKSKGISVVTRYMAKIFGKIRSRVRKSKKHRFTVRTVNATIGVKGTDFVVEYQHQKTTVGTLEGLVEMASEVNKKSISIPPGKMSSIPVDGEVMPLSDIAGKLLSGVEIAGEMMKEDDISGKKLKF